MNLIEVNRDELLCSDFYGGRAFVYDKSVDLMVDLADLTVEEFSIVMKRKGISYFIVED